MMHEEDGSNEGAAAQKPRCIMFRQERDFRSMSLDGDENPIVLSNGSISFGHLGVDLMHVYGCQHHEEQCNFCLTVRRARGEGEEEEEEDPALLISLERLAEALSHYRISDRALARDALTWLSSYEDWTTAYNRTLYFRNHYQPLDEAMLAINRLSDWQVDGRAALYYQRAMEAGEAVDALTYCSWPYIPRPGVSEVYYLRTRAPPHEEIIKYLNTIFDIPAEMIKVITYALAPREKPRELIIGQLRRRLSDRIRSSPPGSPRLGAIPSEVDADDDDFFLIHSTDEEEVAPLSYDVGADPRPARAARLDAMGRLVREQFDKALPHLVLVSEDGSLKELAMRPDYVLRRHERYINVFFLSLPEDAPPVWSDRTEAW